MFDGWPWWMWIPMLLPFIIAIVIFGSVCFFAGSYF